MKDIITIPSAFYEILFERGIEVPQVEEIRRVGKGRQYDILANDPAFNVLVSEADKVLAASNPEPREHQAAINTLRALRRQGVNIDIASEIPAPRTRRVVWVKTEATLPARFGKYAHRAIWVGTDRGTGTILLKIAGTRQQEVAQAPDIFGWCVRSRALREGAEKARAKKAARLARKAERKAARASK